MDPSCLQHGLTNAERNQFNKNGYIILRGILSKEQIATYIDLTMGLYDDSPFFFTDNLLDKNRAFLDLVDSPKILPKVWDLLGWNICLYHSHLSVTPFCGNKDDKSFIDWHQDFGRVNAETSECNPAPRISVKVGYFLTDTMKPRMGNLLVVPGSHLIKGKPNFKKGIQILVRAGDVCIFDRRLWHSLSWNCVEGTKRLAMFYAYSYRWMRPNDVYDADFISKVEDPIRKQLLGHCGGQAKYPFYDPDLDDVPLQMFLLKNKK